MAAEVFASADVPTDSAAVAPGTPLGAPASVATDGGVLAEGVLVSTPLRTKIRGRPSTRPKIDIDAEVEEANRLADLFKRMQHASKIAAKCAMKSKQRLMKKANMLSQQDLMRLAVLKRCGFIEPTDTGSGASGTPAPAVIEAATRMSTTGGGSVGKKLQGLVSSIPGASDLVKALDVSANAHSPAAAAAASSSARCPLFASGARLPRPPVGLKRLPSCPSVIPSPRHKVPRPEVFEEPPLKDAVPNESTPSRDSVASEGEE